MPIYPFDTHTTTPVHTSLHTLPTLTPRVLPPYINQSASVLQTLPVSWYLSYPHNWQPLQQPPGLRLDEKPPILSGNQATEVLSKPSLALLRKTVCIQACTIIHMCDRTYMTYFFDVYMATAAILSTVSYPRASYSPGGPKIYFIYTYHKKHVYSCCCPGFDPENASRSLQAPLRLLPGQYRASPCCTQLCCIFDRRYSNTGVVHFEPVGCFCDRIRFDYLY